MKSEHLGVSVFRDFERLYKLVSFYQSDLRQLTHHIRHCDVALSQNLNSKDSDQFLVKFDFLMTAVYADGKEVFRSDRPELTMYYALFCEGVKSILVSQGLTGEELFNWCTLLRENLKPGVGSTQDLASILWRNKFQHIRIQVYNALLNVEEIGKNFESAMNTSGIVPSSLELADTGAVDSTGAVGAKGFLDPERQEAEVQRMRSAWWELPSQQRFWHSSVEIDEQEVNQLKSMLSDVAYSDKAKGIVKFTASEVEAIRSELESYDQNHVEYNLLTYLFSILPQEKTHPSVNEIWQQQFNEALTSIIDRFHSGLILFALRKMAPVRQHPIIKPAIESFIAQLKGAIEKEDNRRILIESLDSDDGAKNCQEILNFFPLEEWMKFLPFVLSKKRDRVLDRFITFLITKFKDVEQAILAAGPDILLQTIPSFRRIGFESAKFQRLISASLNIRNNEQLEKVLPYIADMDLGVDQATSFIIRIGAALRSRLLQAIQERNRAQAWKHILYNLIQKGSWLQFDESDQVGIARSLLSLYGNEAVQLLVPYVEARRWKVFPRYPTVRESILIAMTQVKTFPLKNSLKRIIDGEKSVFFQSNELKRKLREVY